MTAFIVSLAIADLVFSISFPNRFVQKNRWVYFVQLMKDTHLDGTCL